MSKPEKAQKTKQNRTRHLNKRAHFYGMQAQNKASCHLTGAQRGTYSQGDSKFSPLTRAVGALTEDSQISAGKITNGKPTNNEN